MIVDSRSLISPRMFLIPTIFAVMLVLSSQISFILFHTLAELFAIFIAVLAGVVSWQMYMFTKNHFLMYLGSGYVCIAALDLMHTFTYKGMNIFVIVGGNIPTQFWISARYLEAILLVTAPWFLTHPLKRVRTLSLFSIGAVLVSFLIMYGYFPAAFIDSLGLTKFKVYSEYVIIGIVAVGIYYLYSKKHLLDHRVFVLMILSMTLTMMAELAFTFYVSVYGISNLAGHIFKLFSFWCIYIAIVRTTLREPFSALSKAVTHYDAVPDATVIVDSDGVIRHVNKSACSLAQIEPVDMVGKDSHDVFHGLGTNKKDCAVCRSVEKKSELFACELKVKDGVWYDFSISYIDGENSFVEVIRDISTRKIIELDLHILQSDLIKTQKIAHLGSWQLDLATNKLTWSDEVYQIFGRSRDKLAVSYESFIDSVHPEDQSKVNDAYQTSVSEGQDGYEINHRLIREKTGEIRYVHERCIHEKDCHGKVIRSLGMIHDVTDTFLSHQLMTKKEEELRQILDSMIDGVITIDEQGIIESFNKRAEFMFGYSESEIIGKHITVLMTKFDAKGLGDYLQSDLETDEAHIIGLSREVDVVRKDSHVFSIRLSVTELPKTVNDKRRFIGTCQDLTKIKQQDEQLRRSQKMDALGKLTGGIAHDFNNMLAVITGYAELLQTKLDAQPKLAKYAYEIMHAGERGSKLTKRLLAFSRHDTSEATVVNINELVTEQKDMIQKTLTVRNKIKLELANDVWPIKLDKSDLEDSILNLSINAMHAMSEMESGAVLTIRTVNQVLSVIDAKSLELRHGSYVQLTISDTGCGMDYKTVEKIFEPFYTTKGEKGTGLGLSQVYGFVNRSHGAVKVRSEPGSGSSFSLYFPRYFLTEEDDAKNRDKPMSTLVGNKTILVVDDEESLLELTSEILKQHEFNVFCANSGEEALEVLEQHAIDLLITDVIMPDMDGYQLAAKVKENFPDTNIQLVSGFADNQNKTLIDEDLQNNLLLKPYSQHDLLTKIAELFLPFNGENLS